MIELKSVKQSFNEQIVLNQVSCKIKSGESYVILGQSGVGKTVLLKTMAKLVPIDSGEVKIETQKISMAFQKNALFDSMTVEENLKFVLREKTKLSAKEIQIQCDKFLESVGLKNTNKLYPSELSGGMQKRLSIARALITEPEVILYDEPTAGLDPVTARQIIDLIINLKKMYNSSIVAVLSELERAFQLADKLAFLVPIDFENRKLGATLIETGSPSNTKTYNHPFIQNFITSHKI